MRRLLRPLGFVFLVLLGVFAIGSVVVAVALVLVLPTRKVSFSSTNFLMATPSWAFAGVAFRPTMARADATGWRVAYVLVGKKETVVVSIRPIRSQGVTVSDGQPTVILSDTAGHVYPQQPFAGLPTLGASSLGPTQIYDVTAFSALNGGATAVFVRHAVAGGGTTRIPVNLARLAVLPAALHPNITRVSGRVHVTLTTVARGALLSAIDLVAYGFADPGGQVTTSHSGNMTSTFGRPSQMPATVTLRAAGGVDLAPQLASGPVSHGKVTTAIGFTTPPRHTVVTLTIDNYELHDRPRGPGTTHGHWSFTFRMP